MSSVMITKKVGLAESSGAIILNNG